MQYDSTTYLDCQGFLMLLSTAESMWCIFILRVTQQICQTTKYEPTKHNG